MDPKPFISEADIRRRVSELAAKISHDYAGKEDVALLAVLKGAFIFLADLARQVTVPHRVEFIALSSYGKGNGLERPSAGGDGCARHDRGQPRNRR